jgi:hypothetical protein
MSRFKVGDRIKILSVVATPFVGLEGNIVEVQRQKQNINTLDCYIVVFAWGEKQVFYDLQLGHANSISKANATETAFCPTL